MEETVIKDIEYESVPEMEDGLLIACFDGWGNALEVSRGLGTFLIRELEAKRFARIGADPFYLFKERRPVIGVREGVLEDFQPPGCELYAVDRKNTGRDIAIMIATEPDLRWFRFTDNVAAMCEKIGVKTIVSCGGLLDSVLITDRLVSFFASNPMLRDELLSRDAVPINYSGQSSIHSTLHFEAKKKNMDCVGLYCHCPYYLQGVTHFGLISHIGTFISQWAGFSLNTDELVTAWQDMKNQIQEAISRNPDAEEIVQKIKQSKTRKKGNPVKGDDKIINLEDYLGI